jgi:RNA polymerase sigma factor (sigma-70 family)
MSPAANSPPRQHAPATRRSRLADDAVRRLVGRAIAGDERAWCELVDEYAGLVWSVGRACGLDETEAADVSQITWQRLVEHLDRLHDPARVGAWLATTARRQAVQRRCAPIPVPLGDLLPEPVSDGAAPIAALLAEERDVALAAALAQLGSRDQMLLRMLMADPMPAYADIAAAMDMPIGSIGPTRARALARLERLARQHGLDEADRP